MNKILTNLFKSSIAYKIFPNLTQNYTPRMVSNSIIELGNKLGVYKTIDRSLSTTSVNKDLSPKPVIYTGGDFSKVVKGSSTFVDKSLFIEEIIEDKTEVILITMPRRWGKSLNLDMLRRFLSITVDKEGDVIERHKTDDYKLFNGGTIDLDFGDKKELNSLDIANNVFCTKRQGQYPVIFIDFKDCKGSSLELIIKEVRYKICNTFKKYSYLETSDKLRESEQKLVTKYINHNVQYDERLSDGIRILSELLQKHHDQKVWILIDEYDAVANKAYLEFNEKDAKQVAELFRNIFEPALKGNESLEKGVMTGVQYIVKSGMLSGLNNLSKYNITNTKYSKYYGINQQEIKLLLEHFNTNSEQASKIKNWYNGYKENVRTAEDPMLVDKYNIWSVVNYLNRQNDGFKSYWEDSSLGELIDKTILENPIIKDTVENLINNNNLVLGKLTSDFTISDFKTLKSIVDKQDQVNLKQDGIDLLFSYLFINGYLTKALEINEYTLPNKEIQTEFESKLRDHYNQIFNISPTKFNKLTQDISSVFNAKDKNKILTIVKAKFAPKLSKLINELDLYNTDNEEKVSKGLYANENLFHSLLNNIAIQVVNAKFASERYTTKPNETKGRADMVLSKNNIGLAIEMKYNKDIKSALNQAKEYSKLIKDNDIQIFIGCNITDTQEVHLSGEIVEGTETTNFEYP